VSRKGQAKSGRLPRGTLSPERIIEAAASVASTTGLTDFSVPQVARELGIGVTSIYWHFRSKDELVASLVDYAVDEFYAGLDYPAMESDQDTVLEYFWIYWRRLRERQLWREIFINHARVALTASPSALARSMEIRRLEVERMVDAGLPADEAFRAYAVLSAYTRGFVLLYELTQADYHLDAAPSAVGSNDPEDPLVSEPDEIFSRGLRSLWKGFLDANGP
jgi:AcrR family transcriptional regulator